VGGGTGAACGATTAWDATFATLSLGTVTVKFGEVGGCVELASTAWGAQSKSWDGMCAWTPVSAAGESAPAAGFGIFMLAAAENPEAVGSIPSSGFDCGALATPAATVPPSMLGLGFEIPRLIAVALASEWASSELIGAGATSWDAGGLGIPPTAVEAGSGGGVTRSCVGSGRLLIATAMLFAACGPVAVTEGSATCGLPFEAACASESEFVSDLELDLGAGCEANGPPDFGLGWGVDFAPVLAPERTPAWTSN